MPVKDKTMRNVLLPHLEEFVASLCLSVTISLVLVNVFMRYFLRTGLYWSEEVATICFVWAVFVGAAAAYRRGAHIGVDIVVKLFGEATRRKIQLAVSILLLAINAYLAWLSLCFISQSYTKVTPVLGVSSVVVSSALSVSFLLMTLHSAAFVRRDLKALRLGQKAV